ncbi:mediator of RNA polymerase II transcription subunit 10 isoform X1 [Numida meleagris]|uniref:mediator of RNA polymerase II transcription subunit 10 isoform X1 n=1 Tax=Numida meleagris TaxID=8996 RepID=UPI000B3E2F99|nr:mediator of RNA polymerase II transcription subunit 10 isoform X1 [Numida meleagris]
MRRVPEAVGAAMAMAEKFDSLEEHLEKFVENIRQLGIIVSDFQPSSQAGLNQKLNFMVTGLQDIDKCRQQLHDISVPLEVFEYIDQGRNPQLYTKECLERALAKNEQVKGKIDTMKKFKSLLIQELTKVFPEDMAKYKAIRGNFQKEHINTWNLWSDFTAVKRISACAGCCS